MVFELPVLDPLWVSVLVTIILVVITGYYAREMKKMRIESIKPNFSLRTGIYTMGGGIHALYLINRGGVAREVKIDVKENDVIKKRYFVPSLSLGEEINLDISSENLKDKKGVLEILLIFKDGYDRNLNDSLKIDFESIKKEGREIQFQSVSLNKNLKEINSSLKNIESSISKLKNTRM